MATQDDVLAAKAELAKTEEALAIARGTLGVDPDTGTVVGDTRATAAALEDARKLHEQLQGRADELAVYTAEHQARSAEIRAELEGLPPAPEVKPAGEKAAAFPADAASAEDQAAAQAAQADADAATALEEKRAELQAAMAREDKIVTDAQATLDAIETERDAAAASITTLSDELQALLATAEQAAIDQKTAIAAAEAAIGRAHDEAQRCDATITLGGALTVECQREAGHNVDVFDRHKFVLLSGEEPKAEPDVHCAIVWNEAGT